MLIAYQGIANGSPWVVTTTTIIIIIVIIIIIIIIIITIIKEKINVQTEKVIAGHLDQ